MRTHTLIATRNNKSENLTGYLYLPKGQGMGSNVRQFDALFHGVPVEVAEGKKLVTFERWEKFLQKEILTEESGNYLERIVFENTLFRGVIFEGYSVHNCTFINCQFDGCIISTPWHDNKIDNCDFNGCTFKGSLYSIEATNCTFLVCNFTQSGMYYARLKDTWFLKCNFEGGKFKHVSFSECVLVRPSFRAALFDSVYFRECDITDAVYDGLSVTMGGATSEEVSIHQNLVLKALIQE